MIEVAGNIKKAWKWMKDILNGFLFFMILDQDIYSFGVRNYHFKNMLKLRLLDAFRMFMLRITTRDHLYYSYFLFCVFCYSQYTDDDDDDDDVDDDDKDDEEKEEDSDNNNGHNGDATDDNGDDNKGIDNESNDDKVNIGAPTKLPPLIRVFV